MKKQKPEFLSEIEKVGIRIVKLTEEQDIENLNLLCKEAAPLLQFLKIHISDAFMGALYMK